MQDRTGKFDSFFRQGTPLFLLGLLLLVLIEPWIPFRSDLVATFGDDVVLKVAVVFLIGYVLLLWGESLRLHGLLTGLLEAFRSFDREQAAGGGRGAGSAKAERAARDPRARLEAAKLLLAAMGSDDESIRETSHHNLVRLVGEDFGRDPAAWRDWLSRQQG